MMKVVCQTSLSQSCRRLVNPACIDPGFDRPQGCNSGKKYGSRLLAPSLVEFSVLDRGQKEIHLEPDYFVTNYKLKIEYRNSLAVLKENILSIPCDSLQKASLRSPKWLQFQI